MRTPKDWGHPCPNPACAHYRRMQQGNVRALATDRTPRGQRRLLRCHTCETPFSETRETVFFDLRTAEDKVMMALKMLLVHVDLAGLSVVLGVTAETVLGWRKRSAHHADAVNRPLLRALPVTQVQLDAMGNFRERKQAWGALVKRGRLTLPSSGTLQTFGASHVSGPLRDADLSRCPQAQSVAFGMCPLIPHA